MNRLAIATFLFIALLNLVQCGKHERRLMEKISKELSGFSRYERPVEFDNEPLKVEMKLNLIQIIDVVSKQSAFLRMIG